MNQHSRDEKWQVEVGGKIYEAPFSELSTWIAEGSLQPFDKVRKGNLRWIEAKRVPGLVPFFDAKQKGLPMPVLVVDEPVIDAVATEINDYSTGGDPVNAAPPSPGIVPQVAAQTSQVTAQMSHVAPVTQPYNPTCCFVHPELPVVYVCDGCGRGFCKTCPKSYGGTVKTCRSCGALCRSVAEVQRVVYETRRRSVALEQGFGAADFFNAIGHPLKFKTSLIFGAVLFALFSIGQSVSGIGGIYMIVGAIFCAMLANALTFGVLANTVDSFSQGQTEVNFMPDFEDFSLWDDVIHPFFLSIGIYVASFGPFILTFIVGLYLIMGAVGARNEAIQNDLERIPGTHYYSAKDTVAQSEQVNSVLADVKAKNDRRIRLQKETNAADDFAGAYDEEREIEDLLKQAEESRKAQFESIVGKTPETQAAETEAVLQAVLGLAAPLVVIGAIFFLWGAFFFPATCAVAAYTRSFWATVSPSVGLDTIRRLGFTYVKILFMGFVLVIASGMVSGIVHLVLSPLDLPAFGNLPAKGIAAMFTFYISVVFSCVLGYALFKKADSVKLYK